MRDATKLSVCSKRSRNNRALLLSMEYHLPASICRSAGPAGVQSSGHAPKPRVAGQVKVQRRKDLDRCLLAAIRKIWIRMRDKTKDLALVHSSKHLLHWIVRLSVRSDHCSMLLQLSASVKSHKKGTNSAPGNPKPASDSQTRRDTPRASTAGGLGSPPGPANISGTTTRN